MQTKAVGNKEFVSDMNNCYCIWVVVSLALAVAASAVVRVSSVDCWNNNMKVFRTDAVVHPYYIYKRMSHTDQSAYPYYTDKKSPEEILFCKAMDDSN